MFFGSSISIWDLDGLELNKDELEEEDDDNNIEEDEEWAEVSSLLLLEFEEESGVSGYRG